MLSHNTLFISFKSSVNAQLFDVLLLIIGKVPGWQKLCLFLSLSQRRSKVDFLLRCRVSKGWRRVRRRSASCCQGLRSQGEVGMWRKGSALYKAVKWHNEYCWGEVCTSNRDGVVEAQDIEAEWQKRVEGWISPRSSSSIIYDENTKFTQTTMSAQQ